VSHTIHSPQCGTPFDVDIAEDGRLRTLGCTYAKTPGHGDVTDEAIIAAIEREYPQFRGVPAPKALKDRWQKSYQRRTC
jgi:hypothetical protein